MAIKFGGEFEVRQNPEAVFDFLTDPNKFAPLLPDFRGVTVQDASNFTVKVNVGISYIARRQRRTFMEPRRRCRLLRRIDDDDGNGHLSGREQAFVPPSPPSNGYRVSAVVFCPPR